MSIRQDLQDYISDNGLSQSAVARAVGVTSPVVNQYLHGKYPGNVQEIERKIAAYLQKQREREAERKLEVDYVLTTTAKRVRDVLRLAHVEKQRERETPLKSHGYLYEIIAGWAGNVASVPVSISDGTATPAIIGGSRPRGSKVVDAVQQLEEMKNEQATT